MPLTQRRIEVKKGDNLKENLARLSIEGLSLLFRFCPSYVFECANGASGVDNYENSTRRLIQIVRRGVRLSVPTCPSYTSYAEKTITSLSRFYFSHTKMYRRLNNIRHSFVPMCIKILESPSLQTTEGWFVILFWVRAFFVKWVKRSFFHSLRYLLFCISEQIVNVIISTEIMRSCGFFACISEKISFRSNYVVLWTVRERN